MISAEAEFLRPLPLHDAGEEWVNWDTVELRWAHPVASLPALDDTVFHGDSPEDRLLLGRPAAFCGKQGESR